MNKRARYESVTKCGDLPDEVSSIIHSFIGYEALVSHRSFCLFINKVAEYNKCSTKKAMNILWLKHGVPKRFRAAVVSIFDEGAFRTVEFRTALQADKTLPSSPELSVLRHTCKRLCVRYRDCVKTLQDAIAEGKSGVVMRSLYRISDISFLGRLHLYHELDRLCLNFSKAFDVGDLEEVSVARSEVTDISVLSGLTSLRTLGLRGIQLTDISPISLLLQLQNLFLETHCVVDISPLTSLTLLQKLTIKHSLVSDISALANLTDLTDLKIVNTRVLDVTSLARLTKLTNLQLQFNDLSDISPLSTLIQLTYLDLGSTRVVDISPLYPLIQLRYLSLARTGVVDISPLSGLTQMKGLQFCYTGIEDIAPLSGLLQLEALNLMCTEIKNIAPLSGLTQLQSVELTDMSEEDLCPLRSLTFLKRLVVISWRRGVTIGYNPASARYDRFRCLTFADMPYINDPGWANLLESPWRGSA